MNRTRLLHVVLSVVGIGALVAYLVACRPSFSPDGSKVLFPYQDAKTHACGVAVFDKTTGKATSLFMIPTGEQTKDGKKEVYPPWVQWDRSGKLAIVAWPQGAKEPTELRIVVLSVASGKPVHTVDVPEPDFSAFPLGVPFPEADGGIFLGGARLARIDLQSGQLQTGKFAAKVDQRISLLGHNNAVYYCLESKDSRDREIGVIDPKNLSLQPKAQVKLDRGAAAEFALGAVAENGTIAIPGAQAKKCQVFLVSGDKLQRTIPLELPGDDHELGNLQWAADQKTIYATVVSTEKPEKSKPEKSKQEEAKQEKGKQKLTTVTLGLGEITVDSGAVRTTPIAQFKRKSAEEGPFAAMFQIALSPDGKTIAASTTLLGEDVEEPRDLGLCLVDLSSADRKITKIAPPVSEGPKP